MRRSGADAKYGFGGYGFNQRVCVMRKEKMTYVFRSDFFLYFVAKGPTPGVDVSFIAEVCSKWRGRSAEVHTEGWTRRISIVTVISMIASFYFCRWRCVGVGAAYAVWTGIGQSGYAAIPGDRHLWRVA